DELVTNATAALDSAAALTGRLLGFSRRSLLVTRPVRLDRIVYSLMEIVGRTFDRGIEVSIEVDTGLWLADADATQLEASLLNLAINARDAMPDGGRLDIHLSNVSLDKARADELGLRAGDYVALRVADTGVGMAPGIAQRAFEPFFSAKPDHRGSGLGLSMVYGFARQSRGTVTLDSAPDAGTRITIFLPRTGHENTAGPSEAVAGDDTARSGETARVLVVDDEAPTRSITAQMLAQQGFAIAEAPDGETALERLKNAPAIDLVLTDIRLGDGGDGYALAEAARALCPALPVVFMSGYADTTPAEHGWEDAPLLRKPFSLDDLGNAVRGALDRHLTDAP
ncbi:MAG: ATP-binding protein, partial [Pseudomonadota bacterium]